MIIAVVTGDEAFERRLLRAIPEILKDLRMRLTRLLVRMQTYVKTYHLSGRTLRRRSGNLSRNIFYDVADVHEGLLGRLYVGSGAPYGYVHEKGGTFAIPQHTRMQTHAWRHKLDPPIQVIVRAHTATFPKRAFMQPTKKKFAPTFQEMVADVVISHMRGGR